MGNVQDQRLELFDDEGEPIWSAMVGHESSVRWPTDLEPASGLIYRRVTAKLTNGGEVVSPLVSFTVVGK